MLREKDEPVTRCRTLSGTLDLKVLDTQSPLSFMVLLSEYVPRAKLHLTPFLPGLSTHTTAIASLMLS